MPKKDSPDEGAQYRPYSGGHGRASLRAMGFQGRRYTREVPKGGEGPEKSVMRGMPRRKFLGQGGRPSLLISYAGSRRRLQKEARRTLGAINNEQWREKKASADANPTSDSG